MSSSLEAAEAAKAHPVFRPHFGLSARARLANSAAPSDRSGYGPNVRLNERCTLSTCSSLCSIAGAGWAAGAAGGGGMKAAGVGFVGVSIVGDGRASVGRSADCRTEAAPRAHCGNVIDDAEVSAFNAIMSGTIHSGAWRSWRNIGDDRAPRSAGCSRMNSAPAACAVLSKLAVRLTISFACSSSRR
eukprot:6214774-Pleurochrysis_carterae.AAC.7